MAEIDTASVDFLRKVIREAGRRGDFFIQRRDYARLMRSIDEFRLTGEQALWIDDQIWSDAQRLAAQYEFQAPSARNGKTAAKRNGALLSKPRSRSPHEWKADDPPFAVEGWTELGIDRVEASAMSRHFLILGETGSGKTASGVKPLLRSILSYESSDPDAAAAVLVIDPKSELFEFVNEVMPQRVGGKAVCLDLEKDEYRLHLFEGTETRSLTAHDVLDEALPLSESMFKSVSNTKEAYWNEHARSTIEGVLGVLLHCARNQKTDFWTELTQTMRSKEWIDGAAKGEPPRATLAESIESYALKYDPDNYFLPLKQFFTLSVSWQEACWSAFKSTCNRLGVPVRLSSFADAMVGMPGNQYGSVTSMAALFLTDLASHDLVRHVSLNPIEAPENRLCIEDAIEHGSVLIYSPGDNSFVSDAIGRLIKGKFFTATFGRSNKTRPVAYVCDEFQRFITGDPESGEQSFLDRCRAYRAVCVLATQSIASIKKGLHESGELFVDDCVSIILNNTGTKLFFRNTDIETQSRLLQLIPSNPMPRGAHLLGARPVSTLKIGECYFLSSDGSWGRGRIALNGAAAPQRRAMNLGSADRSTHRLSGEITEETILSLCDEIDLAVEYFQHRHITIEICSVGGAVLALQYFLSKLAEWRKLAVTIETIALTRAASAAAVILSLGDIGHRSAYSTASLLYHNGRATMPSWGTKEDYAHIASDLQRIDSHLQDELVRHIYDDAAARAAINLPELRARGANVYLPALDAPDPMGEKEAREHYVAVIRQLHALDQYIRPEDAKLLGLVDGIL